MKKWMLILAGLVALVAGAAMALLVSINPIVEAGVNMYGPDITGTHVFLKKADISVFSGKGSLHEFTLGNPKGYSTPHAVKVGKLYVELDKNSLLEDVIVIKKIAIDAPDINYEIAKKSNNFDDIIKNVKQMAAASEKAAKASGSSGKDKDGKAKKVVIDELTITGAKAAFVMPMLKLSLNAPLPDIRLTDIGRDKSGKNTGVSMAEAAERVLKTLSGSLSKTSKTAGGSAASSLKATGQAIEASAKKSAKALESSVKDAASQLKEGLGGLFKK